MDRRKLFKTQQPIGTVARRIQKTSQIATKKRQKNLDTARNLDLEDLTPEPKNSKLQQNNKSSDRKKKLIAWRAERNRVRFQEILEQKSPFISVVPVGRYIEKEVKFDKAILNQTPIREKLVTERQINKSTIKNLLKTTEKSKVVPTTIKKLYPLTSIKKIVKPETEKKREEEVTVRQTRRAAKKNILNELDKVVGQKENVFTFKAAEKPKIERKKALTLKSDNLAGAIGGIKKLEDVKPPKEKKTVVEKKKPELEPPKVAELEKEIPPSQVPEPPVVKPAPEEEPNQPAFNFKFTMKNAKSKQTKVYRMFKSSLDMHQKMLTKLVDSWTPQMSEFKPADVKESETVSKTFDAVKKLLDNLKEFENDLKPYEVEEASDNEADSLRDAWLAVFKKIMKLKSDIDYVTSVFAEVEMVKRQTEGMSTPIRRSVRIMQKNDRNCFGCTPKKSASKMNTPSRRSSKKKSVCIAADNEFATPKSSRKSKKFQKTPIPKICNSNNDDTL